MRASTTDLQAFAVNAAEVAGLLKAMSNQRRLMVLCQLAEFGEMRVGDTPLRCGWWARSRQFGSCAALGLTLYLGAPLRIRLYGDAPLRMTLCVGEEAGLPEQDDLFQAVEDAREDGRDQGVQSSGQHSSAIV